MSQVQNRSRAAEGARRNASIVEFTASLGPAIQLLRRHKRLPQNQLARTAEVRKNS